MKYLIYGLLDPREPEHVRYIGRSSTGLKRPKSHGFASKLAKDDTYKANWIRKLLDEEIMFDVVVLELFDSMEPLNEAEQRWIKQGIEQGWKLTNLSIGGDGPFTPMSVKYRERRRQLSKQIWAAKQHTPETIAKLRAIKLGVPRSKETKEKIRASCRRPEAIAKWREAVVGKPKTEEHKKNLSAAHKGCFPSPETRAKMSAAHKGRVFSEETRARIAAAKRGKPRPDLAARNRTPEHIETMRKAHIGVPRPDVSERNRTQAQKNAVSSYFAKQRGE